MNKREKERGREEEKEGERRKANAINGYIWRICMKDIWGNFYCFINFL